jgi:membrane protein YqaA with SNARE-associated domain
MGIACRVQESFDDSTPRPARSYNEWFLDKVLHWGSRPGAIWILFLVALIQSGLFPAPLLVLFITFSLGALHRTFHFALACAAGSIAGGALAYYLGHNSWGLVKPIFIPHVFSEGLLRRAEELYEGNIFLAVLIVSFSPFSYLISSLAAGVLNVNFWAFLLASCIARTLRFLFLGWLIHLFGDRARHFIERHLPLVGWLLLILTILTVIAVIVIRAIL